MLRGVAPGRARLATVRAADQRGSSAESAAYRELYEKLEYQRQRNDKQRTFPKAGVAQSLFFLKIWGPSLKETLKDAAGATKSSPRRRASDSRAPSSTPHAGGVRVRKEKIHVETFPAGRWECDSRERARSYFDSEFTFRVCVLPGHRRRSGSTSTRRSGASSLTAPTESFPERGV